MLSNLDQNLDLSSMIFHKVAQQMATATNGVILRLEKYHLCISVSALLTCSKTRALKDFGDETNNLNEATWERIYQTR